jgi:hypothetical protein
VAVREADSQKRRVTLASSLRSGDPNTRRLAYMCLGRSLEVAVAPKSDGSAEGLLDPGCVAPSARARGSNLGPCPRGRVAAPGSPARMQPSIAHGWLAASLPGRRRWVSGLCILVRPSDRQPRPLLPPESARARLQ